MSSDFLSIDYYKTSSSLNDVLGVPSLNRFRIDFNLNPNILLVLGLKEEEINKTTFSIQALDVVCPNFSLQEGQVTDINGAKRYFMSGRNDGDLKITFLENPKLSIRNFFYRLMRLNVDITHDYGVLRTFPNQYEIPQVYIYPLSYNGTSNRQERFTGVFPINIDMINYSYERHDILKTTVEFKYRYHDIVDDFAQKT